MVDQSVQTDALIKRFQENALAREEQDEEDLEFDRLVEQVEKREAGRGRFTRRLKGIFTKGGGSKRRRRKTRRGKAKRRKTRRGKARRGKVKRIKTKRRKTRRRR